MLHPNRLRLEIKHSRSLTLLISSSGTSNLPSQLLHQWLSHSRLFRSHFLHLHSSPSCLMCSSFLHNQCSSPNLVLNNTLRHQCSHINLTHSFLHKQCNHSTTLCKLR